MPSLIQKHAHVKGQRSNHHIFKFQPNPSWAKKRPNRYTSFLNSGDQVMFPQWGENPQKFTGSNTDFLTIWMELNTPDKHSCVA